MTFFVREAKALEQMFDGGMLDLQASGISKRVTQFEQRDIKILRNQFLEEADMDRQFA